MYNSSDPLEESPHHVMMSDLTCITSSTRSLEFATQEVDLVPGDARVGSVVICRVVSVGAHDKLENRAGRYVRINPGDLIMGVMGNRQSTISMDGGIPDAGITVPTETFISILSTGGVIGEIYSSPSYLGNPTQLQVLGLAYQSGQALQVTPHFLDKHLRISSPLILIVGTSANVGKTRFASKLVHFMAHDLELNVAATKLAGAGNLDDILSLYEHGAKYTFDFVEAGLVTTYGDADKVGGLVVEVAKGVLNHLEENKPDAIIAELGGDILGANVPAILSDEDIIKATSAIILVPSDIFAAEGALSYLRKRGFKHEINVAQPLKTPTTSQKRARNILHERLYDCEKKEDLMDLVERTLKRKREMESQALQTEEQSVENPIATT